jgi:hypothetical protein
MRRRSRIFVSARRNARTIALWLSVAAAFLPTLLPGLHGGHGFPIAPPPFFADGDRGAPQSGTHHHGDAEAARSSSAVDRSRQPDAPPVPDRRRNNNACPICRTLQQLGAVVVPEIATILERDIAGVQSVEPTLEDVSFAEPYDPARPRAPPSDA